MDEQKPPRREPDVVMFLVTIAAACLATMGELALVVSAPTWVVWLAASLPVVFWALLLRQTHQFLRDGQPDDAPSWTESAKRFLARRTSR